MNWPVDPPVFSNAALQGHNEYSRIMVHGYLLVRARGYPSYASQPHFENRIRVITALYDMLVRRPNQLVEYVTGDVRQEFLLNVRCGDRVNARDAPYMSLKLTFSL